jgi:hypothetical protein
VAAVAARRDCTRTLTYIGALGPLHITPRNAVAACLAGLNKQRPPRTLFRAGIIVASKSKCAQGAI